ncbi:MAG: toxin-antitoxin system YwqK family antitoxin [Helicobacteraceae bacterium]|jgi:hypothetical protein|nr:toxin-antitoxin system YwqK family antitoxin [Helicobacteraceae bacterium]
MKRVLIAILLAAVCQSADTDYKIYIVGKTARFDKDNGKCLDMDGNLLSGKAKLQWVNQYDAADEVFCIDGEANEGRGYYDKHDRLQYITLYKNGKLEEERRYYHKSGALQYITSYKNGKVEGAVKTFYENGKLEAEIPYTNGDRDGIDKFYYESGKLKQETAWKNGVIDGIGKSYYENGKLKQEDTWKNGAREGETKLFRRNGAISAVFTYKNDKAISGVCHKTNGKKRPLTKAELDNLNNGLEVNCD